MDAHANLALSVSFLALLDAIRAGGRRRLALWALTAVWAMLVKETGLIVFPFHVATLLGARHFGRRRDWNWGLLCGVVAAVPIIAFGLIALAMGGPVQVIKILNYSRMANSFAGNSYCLQTGSGPWHELLVDQMLVSPLVCVVAALSAGAFLALGPCRDDGASMANRALAAWGLFLLAVFAFLPKNPRHAMALELPIRLASAVGVCALFRALAGGRLWRMAALGIGVLIMVGLDLHSFHRIFVDKQVYDPVASNLVDAIGMLPPPTPVLPAVPAPATDVLPDLIARSLAAYQRRDFAEVVRLSREALRSAPASWPAANNLCAALCQLKRWDEAVNAGERAVALSPNEPLSRNNLAWAQSGQKAAARRLEHLH